MEHLLNLGILIEKVKKPPTWVNLLCYDMKQRNTTIIYEPYQIPKSEEFQHEFSHCAIFPTLDLKQGYFQSIPHGDFRDLTAFAYHKGILQYIPLIFLQQNYTKMRLSAFFKTYCVFATSLMTS